MVEKKGRIWLVVACRQQQNESKYALFTVTIQGETVLIDGGADNEAGNTCLFDGMGTAGNGWITMKHDGLPNFYLLFTRKGAQIASIANGEAQGCGMGVGFDYGYMRKP